MFGVVVTSIFATSLLQIVYGPPGVAVAGVETLSVVLSIALLHGPVPSGSNVSQVNIISVPTSAAVGV